MWNFLSAYFTLCFHLKGLFHVDFAVSGQTIVKVKTTKPWSGIKCFLNTKTKKIGISENMPQ